MMTKPDILIVGAGSNGLVAANYLQRSGCNVTMIDQGAQTPSILKRRGTKR